MSVPATTGQLRTRIEDMNIGDYITCRYTAMSGDVGYFSELGTAEGEEIPVEGTSSPNGIFYLVKVDKGLLVADRVVQHSISWDVLNTNKLIQGLPYEIDNVNITIRSLTGGVAYADEYGNMSLTDKGYGGWPINNEYDKYIVNFPIDLIREGCTLDDVFHWGVRTVTQDTPVNGLGTANTGSSTLRIFRGLNNSKEVHSVNTTFQHTSAGFRPVLTYQEW